MLFNIIINVKSYFSNYFSQLCPFYYFSCIYEITKERKHIFYVWAIFSRVIYRHFENHAQQTLAYGHGFVRDGQVIAFTADARETSETSVGPVPCLLRMGQHGPRSSVCQSEITRSLNAFPHVPDRTGCLSRGPPLGKGRTDT